MGIDNINVGPTDGDDSGVSFRMTHPVKAFHQYGPAEPCRAVGVTGNALRRIVVLLLYYIKNMII